MPFDGATIRLITHELVGNLTNAKIDKIYMHQKDEIVLSLRGSSTFRLLLSSNPSLARILFTDHLRENPAAPPNFCMFLRKHLTGGVIRYIRQPLLERVIIFGIEARDELLDISEKELIFELMGRHSNIILVNKNGKILDSVKKVDDDISSVRDVLPGVTYTPPPPQDKINFLSGVNVADVLNKHIGQDASKVILNAFLGLSPLLSREIVYRATGFCDSFLTDDNLAKIAASADCIFKAIRENNFSPCVLKDAGGKPYDFSCIQIRQYESIYKCEDSPSLLKSLDDFYFKKEQNIVLQQRNSDVFKTLSNLISKYKRKIDILASTLEEAKDAEKYKIKGDLITANIFQINKGDKIARLENYFDNMTKTDIFLDENLSPSENAQKYYAKYNKLKKTFVQAGAQLDMAKKDIEYLESVQSFLENAESPRDIFEIKQELIKEGYISEKKSSKGKPQRQKDSSPHRYISSDGFLILAGRNNLQNDALTLKQASNNDFWFHTKAIHGSHTVVITDNKPVPEGTLLEAAIIAAFHSKAKNSYNVPVDYTKIRFVKKPSGAKPGMVIYTDYKTAFVTPSEEKINSLKEK